MAHTSTQRETCRKPKHTSRIDGASCLQKHPHRSYLLLPHRGPKSSEVCATPCGTASFRETSNASAVGHWRLGPGFRLPERIKLGVRSHNTTLNLSVLSSAPVKVTTFQVVKVTYITSGLNHRGIVSREAFLDTPRYNSSVQRQHM